MTKHVKIRYIYMNCKIIRNLYTFMTSPGPLPEPKLGNYLSFGIAALTNIISAFNEIQIQYLLWAPNLLGSFFLDLRN